MEAFLKCLYFENFGHEADCFFHLKNFHWLTLNFFISYICKCLWVSTSAFLELQCLLFFSFRLLAFLSIACATFFPLTFGQSTPFFNIRSFSVLSFFLFLCFQIVLLWITQTWIFPGKVFCSAVRNCHFQIQIPLRWALRGWLIVVSSVSYTSGLERCHAQNRWQVVA